MTQFKDVYDLMSEDDGKVLKKLLRDRIASASSATAADDDDGDDDDDDDLFFLCRMNAACSSRRVSPVSARPYRHTVCYCSVYCVFGVVVRN